mgnify:CR=1 FL=1
MFLLTAENAKGREALKAVVRLKVAACAVPNRWAVFPEEAFLDSELGAAIRAGLGVMRVSATQAYSMADRGEGDGKNRG